MTDNGDIRRLRGPEPPALDETLARQQIEVEVRADFEKQEREEWSGERDTVIMALGIWRRIILAGLVLVGIPLIGLVSGLCVRLFRWASGVW